MELMGMEMFDKMGMGIQCNGNENEDLGNGKMIPMTHFVLDIQTSRYLTLWP